ncbi:MAG: zf-HC2 domain-containing protein [Deltaproteobacteria bacterium]|nr:zf-HC2 domain-containing protein [Deltaproteobacteria bacterium]
MKDALCGKAGTYYDGELTPDEESLFLAHLAGCAECQRALHSTVQLDRQVRR